MGVLPDVDMALDAQIMSPFDSLIRDRMAKRIRAGGSESVREFLRMRVRATRSVVASKGVSQKPTSQKVQKESYILITPPKHPTNNINVVRTRHPMGSVALPDCSAEAVSKQSQGHAQQS